MTTELGEVQTFTHVSNNSGHEYTSPFEINVYGWAENPDDPNAIEPFVGRGVVIGALPMDESDDPMPVIELDDGTGEKKTIIGLFFSIIPVAEDNEIGPETPRISYDAYMS